MFAKMKRRDYLIMVAIVVGVVGFCAINYFGIAGFYDTMDKLNFTTTDTTMVYMNGNYLHPEVEVHGKLKPTKKLNFDIGEEFTYKEIRMFVPPHKIKTYTREDYINEMIAQIIGRFDDFEKMEGKVTYIYGINTNEDDGRVMKFLIDENGDIMNISYPDPPVWATRIYPEKKFTKEEYNIIFNMLECYKNYPFESYSPWMSALDEDFSWTQIVRRNLTLNISGVIEGMYQDGTEKVSKRNLTVVHCSNDEIITRYKVVGIENVHGRKCFKVQGIEFVKDYGGCNNMVLTRNVNPIDFISSYVKIKKSAILWVDYEKRILVRAVGIDEHGRYEINLE